MKTVLILGGDGFCGWPTALHLSEQGYNIVIVDNFSRRKIDIDLGLDSLSPIASLEKRILKWKELTKKEIHFELIDVANEYERLLNIIHKYKPSAIVHFAEQRAAPYSMRNSACKRYTIDNNISATHNTLCAIVESGLDIHLVHLGSMGVYGYGTAGIPIPEGYLSINIPKEDGTVVEKEILYPPNPGSIYHLTKTQDALAFYFYNNNDNVRITDLHQGIVWGTDTKQTSMHADLVNRFDYDGDYGTVLNRFLVQSVVGHPLTVHGTGGQTRAFIHISDTVKCIQIAIENAPQIGERVKIFNQATETHTVKDLAELVAKHTGAQVRYYKDPRKEDLENTLNVTYSQFLDLGLNPMRLSDGVLLEVRNIVEKYKDRCDTSKIIATSLWSKEQEVDEIGEEKPR